MNYIDLQLAYGNDQSHVETAHQIIKKGWIFESENLRLSLEFRAERELILLCER